MRKKVKLKEYKIIKNNLENMKDSGAISEEFYLNELEKYEVIKIDIQESISFLGALVFIIGVSSFLSNYWSNIVELAKVLILFVATITLVLVSYATRESVVKTSRLLLYISMIINIANMIYINNYCSVFKDEVSFAFILIISILPSIKYLGSRFSFSVLLIYFIGLSFTSRYSENLILSTVIYLVIWTLITYVENTTENFKSFTFGKILRAISMYSFVVNQLGGNILKSEEIIIVLGLFIGIVLSVIKLKNNTKVYNYVGILGIGFFGYMLTDEFLLSSLLNIHIESSVFVLSLKYLLSLMYIAYFMYITSKGYSKALIFVALMVLKNTILSPMIFLSLGALLLVFAFHMEKRKKKGVGENE